MQIQFENVSFAYDDSPAEDSFALQSINLEINKGELICITGATGSGKSTLVQLINGLLTPTKGCILIDGLKSPFKGAGLQKLRSRIGLLFQFSEDQLFEATISKDVAFGLKQFGVKETLIASKVAKAMDLVGLPYETYRDIHPSALSGGEQRRAAIAGVIVTEPDVLILDEPTIGLDPRGKNAILNIIGAYHQKGHTIIAITHDLESFLAYATRMIIMEQGKIVADAKPVELLAGTDCTLIPETVYLATELRKCGWDIPKEAINHTALIDAIVGHWNTYK